MFLAFIQERKGYPDPTVWRNNDGCETTKSKAINKCTFQPSEIFELPETGGCIDTMCGTTLALWYEEEAFFASVVRVNIKYHHLISRRTGASKLRVLRTWIVIS
jgi:hypothetical protein